MHVEPLHRDGGRILVMVAFRILIRMVSIVIFIVTIYLIILMLYEPSGMQFMFTTSPLSPSAYILGCLPLLCSDSPFPNHPDSAACVTEAWRSFSSTRRWESLPAQISVSQHSWAHVPRSTFIQGIAETAIHSPTSATILCIVNNTA
jgi:hypothetical protein